MIRSEGTEFPYNLPKTGDVYMEIFFLIKEHRFMITTEREYLIILDV